MISFTNFLWLLHYILLCVYVWEIIVFIRNKRKFGHILKELKEQNIDIWAESLEAAPLEIGIPVAFLHCFVWVMATDAVPLLLMILSFGSLWLSGVNQFFDYVKKNSQKKEEEPAPKTKQEQFAGSNSDTGYGFDPNQFGDFKERKEAPRGFEDRHPDDAKIWAVIDDPNAPPNVRRTAFDKILQRQEKRQRQEKKSTSSNPKRIPVKG